MPFDPVQNQPMSNENKDSYCARSNDALNNSNVSKNSMKKTSPVLSTDQLISNKSQVSQHSRDGSECSGNGSVFKKDYSVKKMMAKANVPEDEERKE